MSSDARTRFESAAVALGVTVEARRFPDGTRTAPDAAAAIGCEVAQIVKSLVFTGPDGPLVALTSGANRVDTVALAAAAGGPVSMGNADEVRAATGFAIGGTPPFGHPRPLPTFIDADLLDHEVVWAAAGTPDTVFPIVPTRLVEVTAARVVSLAE